MFYLLVLSIHCEWNLSSSWMSWYVGDFLNINIPAINHFVNIVHIHIFLCYYLKIFWLIYFDMSFKNHRVAYVAMVYSLLKWESLVFKDFTHNHLLWSLMCSCILRLFLTLYPTFFPGLLVCIYTKLYIVYHQEGTCTSLSLSFVFTLYLHNYLVLYFGEPS